MKEKYDFLLLALIMIFGISSCARIGPFCPSRNLCIKESKIDGLVFDLQLTFNDTFLSEGISEGSNDCLAYEWENLNATNGVLRSYYIDGNGKIFNQFYRFSFAIFNENQSHVDIEISKHELSKCDSNKNYTLFFQFPGYHHEYELTSEGPEQLNIRIKDEKSDENLSYDIISTVLPFGEQMKFNLKFRTINIQFPSVESNNILDSIPIEKHLINNVWESLEVSYSEFTSQLNNKRKKTILHKNKIRYNFGYFEYFQICLSHGQLRMSSLNSLNDNNNNTQLGFSDSGYKLQVLGREDLDIGIEILLSRNSMMNTQGWTPNCETIDRDFELDYKPEKVQEKANFGDPETYLYTIEYLLTLNSNKALKTLEIIWNNMQLRFEYCNEPTYHAQKGTVSNIYEYHLDFYSNLIHFARTLLRMQKFFEANSIKVKVLKNYSKIINIYKSYINVQNFNPNLNIYMDNYGYQPVPYAYKNTYQMPCYFIRIEDDSDYLCNIDHSSKNYSISCTDEFMYTHMMSPELGISSLYPIMFGLISDLDMESRLPPTLNLINMLTTEFGLKSTLTEGGQKTIMTYSTDSRNFNSRIYIENKNDIDFTLNYLFLKGFKVYRDKMSDTAIGKQINEMYNNIKSKLIVSAISGSLNNVDPAVLYLLLNL